MQGQNTHNGWPKWTNHPIQMSKQTVNTRAKHDVEVDIDGQYGRLGRKWVLDKYKNKSSLST